MDVGVGQLIALDLGLVVAGLVCQLSHILTTRVSSLAHHSPPLSSPIAKGVREGLVLLLSNPQGWLAHIQTTGSVVSEGWVQLWVALGY